MKSDRSYDFHIHSKYSYDSICTPKRILRTAKKKGLSGVAITDHNTIRGGLEALKIDSDIDIIVGSEIKTDKGEIIALFVNEEIKSGGYEDVMGQIRDQDGIIVLPHPYKTGKEPFEALTKKVDIIEIMNARRSRELNDKAMELAKNINKPKIGGSDAHMAFEIGRVRTVFDEEINGIEDVRRLLLKNSGSTQGTESSRYVHYPTAVIGNVRTGNIRGLLKSVKKRIY